MLLPLAVSLSDPERELLGADARNARAELGGFAGLMQVVQRQVICRIAEDEARLLYILVVGADAGRTELDADIVRRRDRTVHVYAGSDVDDALVAGLKRRDRASGPL